MAVVGTAARGVIIYQLDNQPQEFKRMESPLKYQVIAVIRIVCMHKTLLDTLIVFTCSCFCQYCRVLTV